MKFSTALLNRYSQKDDIKFGRMLYHDYKGILLDDGTWVTWKANTVYHSDIRDKYFPKNHIVIRALHTSEGELMIESEYPSLDSKEVQDVVSKFSGDRGSGSRLIIEVLSGYQVIDSFDGTFREYEAYLGKHK